MKFTIFYNTGYSEVIEGTTIVNAKLKHKIYAKAEESIVMYQDGNVRAKYKWNGDIKSWQAKPILKHEY